MKNRGITLVSLVVTIIILIILAGVSLNLILGENGLFQMALKAKENMELAQVEEQEKLNALYTQLAMEGGNIESSGETSYDAIQKLVEFKQKIAQFIENAGGNKIENPITAEVDTFEEHIKELVSKKATSSVIFKSGSGPWDFSEEFPNGENFNLTNLRPIFTGIGNIRTDVLSGNPTATIYWTGVSNAFKFSGTFNNVSFSPYISTSNGNGSAWGQTGTYTGLGIQLTDLKGCVYIEELN